jgi:hypothetical protein
MNQPVPLRLVGPVAALALVMVARPVLAQLDQQKAAAYFKEAALLCERDGGRLWGVSLCGPMVIADPITKTIATNQPAPDAPRPPALGYANAAMSWGGTRWSTFVWQYLPDNQQTRGRLLIHELFHRIQPDLGLLGPEGENQHLDTPDGRYWLQLEWRALARAVATSGADRDAAVRDALGFRAARHRQFPGAAEAERRLGINEGLAQYTGTVVAAPTPTEAVADVIEQLEQAPIVNPTFVRTFPYPLGAAYGILLDQWSPGWTRRIRQTDDLGALVIAASGLSPTEPAAEAAARYRGAELRAAEEQREIERGRRVAQLRARFVEGSVLVLPNGRSNSFITNGITPIPEAGTVYPTFRTTGDWGSLVAEAAMLTIDRTSLVVPGPIEVDGVTVTGRGWTVTLAPGWRIQPGRRAGDFEVVRGT